MNNMLILDMKSFDSIYNLGDFYLKALEHPWYALIADIYNEISVSTTRFYEKRDIKTLLFPTTTSSVSSPMGLGSDSTPVEITMGGLKTYLSDSMQFMLEYGCRIHKNGCYSLTPSFRGEIPDNRHLSQFFHSEAEIPGDMYFAIQLAEEYIKFVTNEIYLRFQDRIIEFCEDLTHIEDLINTKEISQISFDEAIKLLNREDYVVNRDLNFRYLRPNGEKKLIQKFKGFVWVTHFDHLSIPFYQAFDERNTLLAKAADLLLGVGETIGLGERHYDGAEIKKALDFHKISEKQYEWYIELKNRFPLKTSGYGMGVERYICWVLQHNDIRDCQLFLRFNDKTFIP